MSEQSIIEGNESADKRKAVNTSFRGRLKSSRRHFIPMRRLQPPVHLLRAFTATARLGSISVAAASLHLTQSAVSKQVQELERWLGVPLFARVKKRLQLTPSGARYEQAVRLALAQLETATLDMMSTRGGAGVLHLSTLPTIGSKWLIPRLPLFYAAQPKIELRFMPFAQGYDFLQSELDCALRYGEGTWPGACADYIVGRDLIVIAPSRVRGVAHVKKSADIARFPLLQHVSLPNAWADWCEAHGVVNVNPHSGPQLDQYHSLIRAVQVGMGLALVPRCLVADEVAAGQISMPLPDGYSTQAGYYFCYPEAKAAFEPLVMFRDWLLEQAVSPASQIAATSKPAVKVL
jgi:LysR family transcriptional regulator, glycine cleavage system transcriptional activator